MGHLKTSYDEAKCKAFCDYYSAQCGCAHRPTQVGGSIPVFAGSQHQYGAGLGDILRGIFRTVAPILMPIIKPTLRSLAASTISGMEEGKSFKDSIKGGLKPALGTAIDSTLENIQNFRAKQRGSGKRKLTGRGVYKAKKSKASKSRKKSKVYSTKFCNF